MATGHRLATWRPCTAHIRYCHESLVIGAEKHSNRSLLPPPYVPQHSLLIFMVANHPVATRHPRCVLHRPLHQSLFAVSLPGSFLFPPIAHFVRSCHNRTVDTPFPTPTDLSLASLQLQGAKHMRDRADQGPEGQGRWLYNSYACVLYTSCPCLVNHYMLGFPPSGLETKTNPT